MKIHPQSLTKNQLLSILSSIELIRKSAKKKEDKFFNRFQRFAYNFDIYKFQQNNLVLNQEKINLLFLEERMKN